MNGKSFTDHHPVAGRSVVWLSPPHVLEALGPFDLDPCAAPEPRPWPTAQTHYTLPVDGFAQPWYGRVWLNPPYGAETWRWCGRLAEHGRGTALIFARTETSGFVREVWEKATAVLFLHGRLSFYRPDGTKAAGNAGAPSCLVAYGEDDAARLRECGLGGTVVNITGSTVEVAS